MDASLSDFCVARGELPPLPYRASGAQARVFKFRAPLRENLRHPGAGFSVGGWMSVSRPFGHKFLAKSSRNFDSRPETSAPLANAM
jgi:hypothetical protein